MLMQNFKSAADLGITEPQLSALQKTLVLLETGRLIHVPDSSDVMEPATKFTGHFSMDKWSWEGPCGSICCIGGTAELASGLERDSLKMASHINRPLNNLFFPTEITGDWGRITPDQAATALRSYLATGDARWDLAVR